jgi:bacterioferritin
MSTTTKPETKTFAAEIEAIRTQARRHVERGSVTDGYDADRALVLELLDGALATEIVCYLRYKHHHFAARGLDADIAATEFLEHATEELQHADQIAGRIVQLGGSPNLDPASLVARSHADYVPGSSLEEMIRENLVAERIAIDAYRMMLQHLGEGDATTRNMLESILATEEEHADDMSRLLRSPRSSH